MMNLESLEKYRAYQKTIGDKTRESMEAGLAKIRESVGMADDLREMITALCGECEARLGEIDRLKREKDEADAKWKNAEARIAAFREKDAFYSSLNLQTAKLSSLVSDNEDRARELAEAEAALGRDREAFEREKASILRARQDAEDKAKEYKRNWDTATQARDKALKASNDLRTEKAALEAQITQYVTNIKDSVKAYDDMKKQAQEIKTQLEDCQKARDWYKDYAAATDQMIIESLSKKTSGPLKEYHKKLTNPDMLEEHRRYFPEFQIPEAGEDVPRRSVSEGPPAAPDTGNAEDTVSGVPPAPCDSMPENANSAPAHIPVPKAKKPSAQSRTPEQEPDNQQDVPPVSETPPDDGNW